MSINASCPKYSALINHNLPSIRNGLDMNTFHMLGLVVKEDTYSLEISISIGLTVN